MFLCCWGWRGVNYSREGINAGTFWIGIPSRSISTKQTHPPINHYKVLGLTSKSTQAEIKASFYKMSKIFHPDVSDQSEEAAIKFRQITAAYEILGNIKLRKMYDRGLLPHHGNVQPEVEFKEPEVKSPFKKTRSPLATGRTTIYDFDAWSRLHYGTALNRKAAAKQKWHNQNTTRKEYSENTKSDNAIAIVLLSVTVLAVLHTLGKSDYDVPNANKKP